MEIPVNGMMKMKVRDIGYLMVAGGIEILSIGITLLIKRRLKIEQKK